MISTILSIISTIIALAALLCSVIFHFYDLRQRERFNSANIKARYFEVIFDEYLIHKIPEQRLYIRFNEEGKLADFQQLIDILSTMRKSAYYFNYENKEFYDSLKKATQELEDYLSQCGNRSHEKDEQAEVYANIAQKITKVYACITQYYVGNN